MTNALTEKRDFTGDLQALIPESLAVCAERSLEEAISLCLGLEKKCRLANDMHTLKEVCLHMVRMCKQKEDWPKLNSTLAVINKRRAQSKTAVGAIVEEAFGYIEKTPSLEAKIELIKTLKEICQGKIYVEAESARLHLLLARIYEDQGDVGKACDEIQDVHVETYGSLSKIEKAEYILHQIRLNLLRKDYVRALIQSRKMNRTTIDEAGFEEVKVKFYHMMVEYHTHEDDVWSMSQCYFKVYDTTITKQDPVKAEHALQSAIIMCLLAKHDNHQSDFMNRLRGMKEVTVMPAFLLGLTLFTTKEVIAYPFQGLSVIEEHSCLGSQGYGGAEFKDKCCKLLHKRIIQHNLRVMAGYYDRIRSDRLASMLVSENTHTHNNTQIKISTLTHTLTRTHIYISLFL